jgi:hypothetical protein
VGRCCGAVCSRWSISNDLCSGESSSSWVSAIQVSWGTTLDRLHCLHVFWGCHSGWWTVYQAASSKRACTFWWLPQRPRRHVQSPTVCHFGTSTLGVVLEQSLLSIGSKLIYCTLGVLTVRGLQACRKVQSRKHYLALRNQSRATSSSSSNPPQSFNIPASQLDLGD